MTGSLSVEGNGIEPVVALGKLEELLTGKAFDQQLADPASRSLISAGNEYNPLVIKLETGTPDLIGSRTS